MTNPHILQETENPLFNRREVKIVIESKATPSISEAEKIVSENFKSNQENIKIKKVNGKFGRTTFLLEANIYKTPEDKNRTENINKKKKRKDKNLK